jgi:hypothetical protein
MQQPLESLSRGARPVGRANRRRWATSGMLDIMSVFLYIRRVKHSLPGGGRVIRGRGRLGARGVCAEARRVPAWPVAMVKPTRVTTPIRVLRFAHAEVASVSSPNASR